jgi:hypothetical protein
LSQLNRPTEALAIGLLQTSRPRFEEQNPMKPLKLTFRTVAIAALMIIVGAVAFDGLRKYNKMNAARNETSHQLQVEPPSTSVSAAVATPSI